MMSQYNKFKRVYILQRYVSARRNKTRIKLYICEKENRKFQKYIEMQQHNLEEQS